jgi:hypothetical protein
MHLHCLAMDGVYQRGEAGPVFLEVRVPRSDRKLQIRVLRTGRSGTPASGREPNFKDRFTAGPPRSRRETGPAGISKPTIHDGIELHGRYRDTVEGSPMRGAIG